MLTTGLLSKGFALKLQLRAVGGHGISVKSEFRERHRSLIKAHRLRNIRKSEEHTGPES